MERLNSPDLDPKIKEQFKEGMGFAGPEILLVGLRKPFRFEQDKEDGKTRRQAGLDPPGDLEATSARGWSGPINARSPRSASCRRISRWTPRSTWARTMALPYKLVLKGQKPTTADRHPQGRHRRPQDRLDQLDRDRRPTSITLEYSNVQLNPTLDLDEFAFQAPPRGLGRGWHRDDRQAARSAIAMQAERKKAEAAKKEGPVLDQSLEVPRPPARPRRGRPLNKIGTRRGKVGLFVWIIEPVVGAHFDG